LDNYQPILSQIEANKTSSDQQCYLLRLLLIHEYRRILLKDHELPQNMLPDKWAGLDANELVKESYSLLTKSSHRFIISNLHNIDGYLSKVINSFNQRFK